MDKLEDLRHRFLQIKDRRNPAKIRQEIQEIEVRSSDPGYWQDQEQAARGMKRLSGLQKEIAEIDQLEKLISQRQTDQAEKMIKKIELILFFADKYDTLPAILSIHAGQGGVEAMDWAQMLERMYIKYCEKRNWDLRVLDENSGEEAGIKSVTIAIDEPYAYGFLKFEAGTHRLVRQSPFNADRLRQTSFALVEVLPQIEERDEIQIAEDDLEWQFFRSSTQGGQNVQKVSTAVRLHHKPSGIIVTCQTQRYQEQNRKIALQLLRSRLWQQEREKKATEITALKGGRTKAAWGTQIRSYVLHPYKMVKDLRTEIETQNVDSVLDGGLERFIEGEIRLLTG